MFALLPPLAAIAFAAAWQKKKSQNVSALGYFLQKVHFSCLEVLLGRLFFFGELRAVLAETGSLAVASSSGDRGEKKISKVSVYKVSVYK